MEQVAVIEKALRRFTRPGLASCISLWATGCCSTIRGQHLEAELVEIDPRSGVAVLQVVVAGEMRATIGSLDEDRVVVGVTTRDALDKCASRLGLGTAEPEVVAHRARFDLSVDEQPWAWGALIWTRAASEPHESASEDVGGLVSDGFAHGSVRVSLKSIMDVAGLEGDPSTLNELRLVAFVYVDLFDPARSIFCDEGSWLVSDVVPVSARTSP